MGEGGPPDAFWCIVADAQSAPEIYDGNILLMEDKHGKLFAI